MTTPNPADLVIQGIDQMEEVDRADIAATLARLFVAFARRDASLLSGVYTPDADWINAFGSFKKGEAEIGGYLRGLFADQNFDDGRVVAGPDCTLRRLDADNAVVLAHLQIAGQGLVNGGTIPLRDNRSVRVVSRQGDGSWRVVTEMFMDARTDASYIDHS